MKLLTCPECGNDSAELSYDGEASVMCAKCHSHTEKYPSVHEAVCAWNNWAEWAGIFAVTQPVYMEA